MNEPDPDPQSGSKDASAGGEDALARTLQARRPAPARPFGDQLRERLLAEDARSRRPPRLSALVLAYVSSGTLLLILAALLA
jgi:hypothetical protein